MREFVVRRQRAHRYGAPSPPTLHSTPQHPRDLKNLPSSLPPLHPRHFLFFFNPSPSSSLLTATTTTTTGAATRSAAGDKKEKKNIARPRMEGELVLPPPVAHSFFLFFLLPRTWPVGAIPCTRFCPPPPRALGGHFILFPSHGRAPPLRSLPLDPRRKLALSRLLRVAFALTVPAVLATCACGSGESSSGRRRRSGGTLFSYFFQVGFLLDSCAPSIGIAGQVFRRTGGGRRAGGGFALFPACFLFDRGWFVILEAEGLILAYSGVTCSICHFFKWVASM